MFLLTSIHLRLLPKYLNIGNNRPYFSEPMTHSLHRSLLNTFYVPDTVLRSHDTVVNKTGRNSCLRGAYILEGKIDEE